MRALARRHPVLVFAGLTLAYSWTLWGLMIASARGWLPFPFATSWTGSFGPAFGAVVTAALLDGRRGIDGLLRPAGRWRFGRGWWLFVTLGGLVPFLAALAAWIGLHGRAGGAGEVVGKLPLLLVFYPIVLVLGGPLGEEIGWRGFALPVLLRRHSPLVASFLVAALWALWHLPLFWLEGAAQKGSSILLFAAVVLVSSLAFTWVYRGTGGSLLSVILLHTGINVPALLIGEEKAAFAESTLFDAVELGLWLALVLVVLALGRKEWLRKPGTL